MVVIRIEAFVFVTAALIANEPFDVVDSAV